MIRIPDEERVLLLRIVAAFPAFHDNGCSNAPDAIFWWDLRWPCRIHDWRYCSRAHDPWELDQEHRAIADQELGRNVRAALPWALRWLGGLLYWRFTDLAGGRRSWDSCGPEDGERCRHNLSKPGWMLQNFHRAI